MLKMNEFEKIAQEIIEMKEEKIKKKSVYIGFICLLLNMIFVIVSCYLYFNGNEKWGLRLILIVFIGFISIPLYYAFFFNWLKTIFKIIMLKSDKEYKIAVEILENYKKHCKEEKILEKQLEEKEYIDKINKLEEYAKNLKNK
jgi:hypothetical protein